MIVDPIIMVRAYSLRDRLETPGTCHSANEEFTDARARARYDEDAAYFVAFVDTLMRHRRPSSDA